MLSPRAADAVGQSVYRHTLGFIDNGTATTGYIKHGIRWNDTTTGTWTTQDPLNAPMDPTNANRYLYATADPINNQDHSGRLSESDKDLIGNVICAAGGLALSGAVTAPAGFLVGGACIMITVGTHYEDD